MGVKVKGVNKVIRAYKAKVANMTEKQAKAALTKAIVYAAGASKELAPIEFGNLINSQFREVKKTDTGWRATLGYTVGYALPLEKPKKGGRLDGWQPRPPGSKSGPAWNPISKQGFLRLAILGGENKAVIEKILRTGIKLK